MFNIFEKYKPQKLYLTLHEGNIYQYENKLMNISF